ncbi:hypothetical protein GQ42DRAFT_72496 [Ramicandelaber brevisporus]|nr:hypothetical protein GQ42DRAFT_72496 [Ramicandelaber brevisporus]
MKTLFYSTALFATLAATAAYAKPTATASSTPTKTAAYVVIPSNDIAFRPGSVQVVGGGNVYIFNQIGHQFTGVIGPTPCQDPGVSTATVLLNPSQTATVKVPTTDGTAPVYLWFTPGCGIPLTIDRRPSTAIH